MFDASHAIDPLYYSNELINSSYVTIFEIYSEGVRYHEIRDDPLFPALQWLNSRFTFNNETLPGLLGCVDNVSFCDPGLKKCWNYPEPVDSRFKDGSSVWGKPPRKFNDMGPKPDLARALLYNSVEYSFIGTLTDYALEGNSHCIDTQAVDPKNRNACKRPWQFGYQKRSDFFCPEPVTSDCGALPRNQWKVEARQMFETSLATMQFNILDMVRGKASDWDKDFQDIPSNYRGMCRMGKFKSTGWQNVSFWPLLGLFFLCAAISLASVKTEKEELWLVLGAVMTYRAFLWGKHQLKTIPWASIPWEIFQYMSALAHALARKFWWNYWCGLCCTAFSGAFLFHFVSTR